MTPSYYIFQLFFALFFLFSFPCLGHRIHDKPIKDGCIESVKMFGPWIIKGLEAKFTPDEVCRSVKVPSMSRFINYSVFSLFSTHT